MGLERKGRVQDDAQVAHFGGWGDGTAGNLEEEITNLLVQRLGSNEHDLCFIAVELEKVVGQPGLYFMDAVDNGGWRERSGR